MTFSEVTSSDMQPCLFSSNMNQLFKQNEDISRYFTLQNISGFLEHFDGLIQGYLCPPFWKLRRPWDEIAQGLSFSRPHLSCPRFRKREQKRPRGRDGQDFCVDLPLKILSVVIHHLLLHGLALFKVINRLLEIALFLMHHPKVKQRLGCISVVF